jgi:hypothetical protein
MGRDAREVDVTGLPFTIPALVVKPPWADAIVRLGKGLENRSRSDGRRPPIVDHRGPLLILASASVTRSEWALGAIALSRVLSGEPNGSFGEAVRRVPRFEATERGGIVGVARGEGMVAPDGRAWIGGVYEVEGVKRDRHARISLTPDVARWHVPGSWALVLANQASLPFCPLPWQKGDGDRRRIFPVEVAKLSPETREALVAWWAKHGGAA